MNRDDIINSIVNKFQERGENPDTHLQGLLNSEPINYWDYVEVETLLTLQKPKTAYKDEEIFIMYHQLTEITFKMIIHEIKQLVYSDFNEAIWIEKFDRMNRYTSMLITSFDIMKYGMNYEDYNRFRTTLTPASGFQSAQFRLIEIYCTRLLNLIEGADDNSFNEDSSAKDYFEYIYWKAAGVKSTGKKTLTLQQFEDKYLGRFIALADKIKGKTLEERLLDSNTDSEELRLKIREFDYSYNISWPMVHIQTAEHYLTLKGKTKEATGGSNWKKYLHPQFQQRIFFPSVWSSQELKNWGKQKLKA